MDRRIAWIVDVVLGNGDAGTLSYRMSSTLMPSRTTSRSQRPASLCTSSWSWGAALPLLNMPMRSRHNRDRPDAGDGGKAPLDDAGAALGVAGDQLAGLLGKVERYRGRLGHHEAVVVDKRSFVSPCPSGKMRPKP